LNNCKKKNTRLLS